MTEKLRRILLLGALVAAVSGATAASTPSAFAAEPDSAVVTDGTPVDCGEPIVESLNSWEWD